MQYQMHSVQTHTWHAVCMRANIFQSRSKIPGSLQLSGLCSFWHHMHIFFSNDPKVLTCVLATISSHHITFRYSTEMCEWKLMMQTFKIDIRPQQWLQNQKHTFSYALNSLICLRWERVLLASLWGNCKRAAVKYLWSDMQYQELSLLLQWLRLLSLWDQSQFIISSNNPHISLVELVAHPALPDVWQSP